MQAGSNVLEARDVRRPLPLPGIHRASEHKGEIVTPPRRLQEKFVQLLLAVRRVSAQVTQRAKKFPARRHAAVQVRIDTSEKRPRELRPIFIFEFLQSTAAGERKIEIEPGYLLAPKITQASGVESVQGNGSVEIVE